MTTANKGLARVIEPVAANAADPHWPLEDTCILSIAISLRRIADALEQTQEVSASTTMEVKT